MKAQFILALTFCLLLGLTISQTQLLSAEPNAASSLSILLPPQRPIGCQLMLCQVGYVCIDSRCVKLDLNPLCPVATECQFIRPNFETCPVVNWLIAPEATHCGVTSSGQILGFAIECEACRNKNITKYYKGSCDALIESGCIVNGGASSKCDTVKCSYGYTCVSGKCIRDNGPIFGDKCALIKCSYGYHCVEGKCVKDGSLDGCETVKCSAGYVCQSGKCVRDFSIPDGCETVKCSAGYVCQSGKCVRDFSISDGCETVKCSAGYVCQSGKCVRDFSISDGCETVKCSAGYFCQSGRCRRNSSYPIGTGCETVKCSAGYVCQSGKCVRNSIDTSCYTYKCPVGYYCRNRKCVRQFDFPVPIPFTCINIRCPLGMNCLNGKCYNLNYPTNPIIRPTDFIATI